VRHVVRLADDGEIGTLCLQRRKEFVDVTTDPAAIGRDGSGIDHHARSVGQEELRDVGTEEALRDYERAPAEGRR
jgi:hypothetical protein